MTGRRLIQPGSPISLPRSTLDLSYLAEALCPSRDLVSVVPRHSLGASELSTARDPSSSRSRFFCLLLLTIIIPDLFASQESMYSIRRYIHGPGGEL
ncbi:hypothetical protein BDV11DRAFT_70777 [Aspergillus similis]